MTPDRSQPRKRRYDLIVIGAGAGGLVTAGGAAQLGADVLLVEQHRLGGECLYTGCVPSKAVIHQAALARSGGSQRWAEARAHVDAAIATIEPHDSPERFEGFGVEVVFGHAIFTGPASLEIRGHKVAARRIVIATGSDPAIPPIPGLETLPYLTNDTVFSLETTPSHLAIIGGGVVGCELAQAFARLKIPVTLVTNAGLLSRSDAEATAVVEAQLEADGVTIHKHADITKAAGDGTALSLTLATGQIITASHILVATGRRARTTGYGLEAAGVDTGKNGITTDAYLRTSNRQIYAIGDCREGPRLTHAADQDARTVIQNALFPFRKRKNYKALPAAIFTDPELAQVGLTEAEAREKNEKINVYRHGFDDNDRAVTESDTRGFVKIITSGKTVLGVTIVGPRAGDILALASFLVSGKLSLSDLANQTIAYPTFAEALRHAAEQPGQAALFTPFMKRLTRLFQRLP